MIIDKPLTKEQIKTGDLIPAGIYTFEVMEAIDGVSKAGNDQIKLKLRIFMPDGRERVLFDYLTPKMEFKIAQFCDMAGIYDKYAAGEFYADDCWGKSGECKIVIQKDKDGNYPDKSAVSSYILSDKALAAKQERKIAEVKQGAEFEDSEIPF